MKKKHAEKLRSSRRHGRPKGSSNSKRSPSADVGRSVVKEEGHHHEGGSSSSSSSRAVRATCKKSYQCRLCPASFVKEHSLHCHMRHHASERTVENVAVLTQLPAGHPVSGTGETVYKLSSIQPSSGLYIQLEADASGGRPVSGKPSSYAILTSQDGGQAGPGPQPHRPRGLDQIVDAAARLYEEQYDAQTHAPQGQEEGRTSSSAAVPNPQHVHIVELPVEFSSMQYSDAVVGESFISADDLQAAVLHQDSAKADAKEESKLPVYFENIILSDRSQTLSADSGLSGMVVEGGGSHRQATSGSFTAASKSSPTPTSPPKQIMTYICPFKVGASSPGTVLGSPPAVSYIPRPSSQASIITYLSPPASAAASQQQVSPQLQQVVTQLGGQKIALVQQPDTKEIKFLPASYTLSPLSATHTSLSPPSTTITSVSGALSQTLSTSTSPSLRRSLRSRPRAIKPMVDLLPASSVPVAAASLSQAGMEGGIVSGVVTMADSTLTSTTSSLQQNSGIVGLCGGCLTSQRHACISLGWICLDSLILLLCSQLYLLGFCVCDHFCNPTIVHAGCAV